MVHDNRYVWLDFIRGISAIIVCGGHLRAAMFIDYSQLETTSIFKQLFYFITGLGHQSVLVFFVLSGFFVGGSVINSRHRFKFIDYLIARLSRLWVVLIPALIFTSFIDLYIINSFSSPFTAEHDSILASGTSTNYSISVDTLLGNIIFLQGIYFPVFGSNGPLWSLTNEFWYYMFFPLIAICIGYVHSAKIYRVLCAFTLVLLAIFIAQSILEGFIIWLMGVVVFCIYKKPFSCNYFFVFIAGALFSLSLVDSKVAIIHANIPLSSDLLVAITFSLFIVSIKGINAPKKVYKLIAEISKWLSEISYSLYLSHFPIVMLIYVNFYAEKQLILGFNGLIQYTFWLSILFLLAVIFWLVFERNTSKVRSWMTKLQLKVVTRL